MDGSVTHMFYNEFIYIIYFQLTPMLLVWDFHVCVWRGTIIIYYLTAVFFVCIGFYKILIKLLLLYLLLLFNLHDGLVIVGYNYTAGTTVNDY